MKRTSFLRRHNPMRRKRITPRRSGRVRDPQFVSLVHQLGCDAATYIKDAGPCDGPIEAHHAGERPLGRKADDDTCIALCRRHHRDITDHTGAFKAKRSFEIRAYEDAAIARSRVLVAQLMEAA